MRREIKSAVNFLANMLRSHSGKIPIDEQVLEQLSLQLRQVLSRHYKHHWHPEAPQKGSAYRCVRINHKLDPLIIKAGQELGIEYQKLVGLFPKELTLWIDPGEVSYRIGEDGTICVLYESKKNRATAAIAAQQTPRQQIVKVPSSKSSPISSRGSSPRSSPTTHFNMHNMVSDSHIMNNYQNRQFYSPASAQPNTCRQEVRNMKNFGQYQNSHIATHSHQQHTRGMSGSPTYDNHTSFYPLGNGLQHQLAQYVVS